MAQASHCSSAPARTLLPGRLKGAGPQLSLQILRAVVFAMALQEVQGFQAEGSLWGYKRFQLPLGLLPLAPSLCRPEILPGFHQTPPVYPPSGLGRRNTLAWWKGGQVGRYLAALRPPFWPVEGGGLASMPEGFPPLATG